MITRRYPLSLLAAFLCIFFSLANGCKKEADADPWIETNEIAIMAYKSNPENGKEYLNIIYENTGHDTYRKIKYQLFIRTGTKTDTVEKTIIPTTVFAPKERRLIPRHIGEEPVTFDEVKPGKVWAIKDKP